MKQIETPRLPDPIMRRPPADREEKRVTHVNETNTEKGSTGQLDVNDPNQRGLLNTGQVKESNLVPQYAGRLRNDAHNDIFSTTFSD